MRRADTLVTTERALALALVLVAVGYAPAAISPRALAALAPVHREATESSETRSVTVEDEYQTNRAAPRTDVELLARIPVVESGEPSAPCAWHLTPYRPVFLSPPSQRGPPALS